MVYYLGNCESERGTIIKEATILVRDADEARKPGGGETQIVQTLGALSLRITLILVSGLSHIKNRMMPF